MEDKSTINIRIGWKEFKKLTKIFPAMEGESMVNYFRRYVAAVKEKGR